jgi:uncharacterized protein YhaN
MTEGNHDQSSQSSETDRNRWVDDAQAALDRTVEAIKSAWDATRESRMGALDSAKQAAEDLGKVIEQGVAAAKERWSAEEDASAAAPEDAGFDE